MRTSKIEWTEETWNPSAGCSKVSSGCKNCYAEVMAKRQKAMGTVGYENGFAFSTVPSRLIDPIKNKKPTVYFVTSMSDIFHEDMPEEYLNQIFDVIERTPWHTYQILTKRADRMLQYFSNNPVPNNVWLGVTVDNRKQGLPRIDKLRHLEAKVLFLSVEPLLEDLGEMNLEKIDWVIVGGESGNRARPMEKQWVLNIKQQCEENNVAFFFKQWGTWGEDGIKRSKKLNGKELDGKIWQQYPEVIEQRISINENEEASAIEDGDMINDGIYSELVDQDIYNDLDILESFKHRVMFDTYFLDKIYKSICDMNHYLPKIIGETLYEFIKNKIKIELKKHFNDINKAEKQIVRLEKKLGINRDYEKMFISRSN